MTAIDINRCAELLYEIGQIPVAPFHEKRIKQYILKKLSKLDVRVSEDEYGNIIAVYEGAGAKDTGGIALGAHMDHPAVEIVNNESGYLLGSIHKKFFDNPVSILVYPSSPQDNDIPIKGMIRECEKGEDGLLHFKISLEEDLTESPCFGVWDIPAAAIKDNYAHMRAVDDVAGCALVITVLEELTRIKAPCRCYGIFTRAEEVGFIGASALIQQNIIPKDAVVVSIETSKSLPDAVIGNGPVIRAGDAIMTFDGKAEFLLQHSKKLLLKENPDRHVQRQLMTGGGCEGTVYSLAGYPTTGLAIPLGNYHNMGVDNTIMPEYVDLNDFCCGAELLITAAANVHCDYESELRSELLSHAERFYHRLRG
jgi:putative aminopeptidase FrvX